MIHTKTKILAAVFLCFLGLNGMDSQPMQSETLPRIEGISKDSIQRFELTQLGQKIRFEKQEGVWMIKAPFEAKADQARVKALLLQFRKPISMDVMLERGEEKQYGLDASNSIVLEIWGEGATPVISFALGKDGTPGSSFVRLSNDNAVYRARVGGRHRYDYPHAEWKNQQMFDFSEPIVQQIDIQSSALQYSLKRQEGVWTVDPKPSWKWDVKQMQNVVARLGSLRIGRVQQEPLTRVDLNLSVQFREREPLQAQIQVGEYAVVQIGEERYQTAGVLFRSLAQNPMLFRDYRVLTFNPRTELDTITYLFNEEKIVIQQDLSNGFWRVLEPAGVNLDLRPVFFMVNSLAETKALAFGEHGEDWKPSIRVAFRLLTGQKKILEIGPRMDKGFTAQIDGIQCILDEKLVEKIQRAFGKSMPQ